MSDLRTARLALAELLRRETGLQVTPHPPRVKVAQRQIFFGARYGSRADQSGGDRTRVPVVVVLPSTTDGQFDVLDEYIDGPKSIVDIIAANPNPVSDVMACVDGDWTEEIIEIETIPHLGLIVEVDLWY